jgi:4-amino-4-deoxy-L-arabinose transferase-like glycosyltransferase
MALSGVRARLDLALLLILAFGLVVRLAWLAYMDAVPVSDAESYFRLASNLANGIGYEEFGRPTAYWPVGYPATLAIPFELFGPDVWSGEAINVLASLAVIALTYVLGRQLHGRRAGLLAAGLMAALPSQIFYNSVLISEPLFTASFLGATVLAVAALAEDQLESDLRRMLAPAASVPALGFFLPAIDEMRVLAIAGLLAIVVVVLLGFRNSDRAMLYWAGAGLLTGYALLIRPTAIVLLPAVLLAIFLLDGRRLSAGALKSLGVYALVTAAVIMPWVARNWSDIGAGTTLATNGAVNLMVGNHDGATGCWSFDFENQLYVMAIQDEAEREREALREVWRFVRDDPLQALSLLPRKFDCMWQSDSASIAYWNSYSQPDRPGATASALLTFGADWYYYGLLALAAIGIPAWWRTDARRLLPVFIVALTALYYLVFFGDDRFHQPLLPFFAVWAACGLLVVPRWLRERWDLDSTES